MRCLNGHPQTTSVPCLFAQGGSVFVKPEVAEQAPAGVCFGAHLGRHFFFYLHTLTQQNPQLYA